MAFLEPDRYFARISRIDIDRDLLALDFRKDVYKRQAMCCAVCCVAP